VSEYVQVAVPRPLHRLFTYRVPADLRGSVRPGQRVRVPFGGARRTTGVVVEALEPGCLGLKPAQVRDLDELLDDRPSIPEGLLKLCLWVADYYLAAPGEALAAALPPGMQREGAEVWRITEAGREALEAGGAPEEEVPLLEALAKGEGRESALARRKGIGRERLPRRLARLEDRGWARRRIVMRGPEARPLTRWMVRPTWDEETPLPELLERAGKSEHRRRLLGVLHAVGTPMPRPALLEEASARRGALGELEKMGLVGLEEEEVWRAPEALEAPGRPEVELNVDQAASLEWLREALAAGTYRTALLQGVTGSGKTEVYLRALRACLDSGRGGIVLVPEIGLTPMLFRLFRAEFGGAVALLHSALSAGERYDEWRRVRSGEARIVVGARSAIFAPVQDLGLVVVDEEQDTSYKQENSPRYNARDVAVMRARMEGALCLMASATPSLESAQRAEAGKYQHLVLRERAKGRLPRVEVVNMAAEFHEVHEQKLLSRRLHEELLARKERGEQAILLLNRRGWAFYVLCRECGESRNCPHCSVALAVHHEGRTLICHYCDHKEAVPRKCDNCGGDFLQLRGEGTEQLEEVLRKELPELRAVRLDRDVAQARGRAQQVLGDFEAGRYDVLLGTQMVAKGHDFPRVTLVGVLSADQVLGMPDFRASERTFQLLTQVAGRSGRAGEEGLVLIQVFATEHYAVKTAVAQDYDAFYRIEIENRRRLAYPPFTSMIQVIVKDEQVNIAYQTARDLAGFVRAEGSDTFRVVGPAIAPLAKIRDLYRFQVILRGTDRPVMNTRLRELLRLWESSKGPPRRVDPRNVELDVDPLSMM